MNTRIAFATVATVALVAGAHSVKAEEQKLSGTSCWTGRSNVLATSPKDLGMGLEFTGTYTADDGKGEDSSYRCVGLGGYAAGMRQAFSWWCMAHYADGSTVLFHGSDTADGGTKDTIVSGTGRYEGVTGSWRGGTLKPMGKLPSGQFAGCRRLSGAITMK
ncbi:MAG: hypothetical protein R3E83_02070 [Burkholderiaceae bacterium]